MVSLRRSVCADDSDTNFFLGLRLQMLVDLVAANVDPLPTIVGPAGIVSVVVVRTTKAERVIVEPMVEMVMEVVMTPCGAPAPSLNTSAGCRCRGHRAAARHGTHTSATHCHGACTATMPAASRRSTTAPKTMGGACKAAATTETATMATTTAASTTVSRQRG